MEHSVVYRRIVGCLYVLEAWTVRVRGHWWSIVSMLVWGGLVGGSVSLVCCVDVVGCLWVVVFERGVGVVVASFGGE